MKGAHYSLFLSVSISILIWTFFDSAVILCDMSPTIRMDNPHFKCVPLEEQERLGTVPSHLSFAACSPLAYIKLQTSTSCTTGKWLEHAGHPTLEHRMVKASFYTPCSSLIHAIKQDQQLAFHCCKKETRIIGLTQKKKKTEKQT